HVFNSIYRTIGKDCHINVHCTKIEAGILYEKPKKMRVAALSILKRRRHFLENLTNVVAASLPQDMRIAGI
ncbi:hypothetical protein, partial [Lacticaseibacillus paracasei]|uniref:hypothetical protein n=1 Tax=Lacticaseibacillus paracasei TaxID=1597 RepID=UPI0005F20A0D